MVARTARSLVRRVIHGPHGASRLDARDKLRQPRLATRPTRRLVRLIEPLETAASWVGPFLAHTEPRLDWVERHVLSDMLADLAPRLLLPQPGGSARERAQARANALFWEDISDFLAYHPTPLQRLPHGKVARSFDLLRKHLVPAVEEAFHSCDEAGQLLFASVLEPEVQRDMGLVLTDRLQDQVDALRREPGRPLLREDELLALVNYLHPTGQAFLVMNEAARLKAYWGQPEPAREVGWMNEPYHSALRKLACIPGFQAKARTYYKGVDFSDGRVFSARLLDYLATTRGRVFTAHPVSTTADPAQSFALRDDRYTAEIQFKGGKAVDVTLFHGKEGKQLGEVLLLETQFRVSARRVVQRDGFPCLQYVLEAVDEPTAQDCKAGPAAPES